MGSYDVYLPVCVQVRGDTITGAYLDWEGAPWMLLDETDSAFDNETDEWVSDGADGLAGMPIPEYLAWALSRPGVPFRREPARCDQCGTTLDDDGYCVDVGCVRCGKVGVGRVDPFARPAGADRYGDPLAGEYEDSEG